MPADVRPRRRSLIPVGGGEVVGAGPVLRLLHGVSTFLKCLLLVSVGAVKRKSPIIIPLMLKH